MEPSPGRAGPAASLFDRMRDLRDRPRQGRLKRRGPGPRASTAANHVPAAATWELEPRER